MATHNLRLDTSKQLALPIGIDARVGEVGSCVIVAEITNNGEPMSLVGYTARFECCKPDKTVVRDAKCTIAGNKITYTLDKSATAVPGLVNVAYFALLKGSDVIETTANIAIRVMPSAESAGSGVSKDYL
ncbi:BppU family phage baseplate upper protein, partial [Gordonibacter sp.]